METGQGSPPSTTARWEACLQIIEQTGDGVLIISTEARQIWMPIRDPKLRQGFGATALADVAGRIPDGRRG
jgi:hypothetical protein